MFSNVYSGFLHYLIFYLMNFIFIYDDVVGEAQWMEYQIKFNHKLTI